MNPASLRLAVIATAIASSGCGLWPWGPSTSVAGTWHAPGIGHQGNYYELELSQSGERMSGVACGSDSGFLLFHDVAVTGNHPSVRFTDPAGGTFSGKYEGDREHIAGEYGPSRIPLRFMRSDAGRCAGTKPLPGSVP